MRKAPLPIDLSDLAFLRHGDLTRIAKMHRDKYKKKTHPFYVGEVLAGKHRNDEILIIALTEAKKIKSLYQ
jgi:hypothetical protein